MMKYLFYALFVLVFNLKLVGQPNLVPNPSFEEYKNCLTRNDGIFIDSLNVKEWFLVTPLIQGKLWGGFGQAEDLGGGGLWAGGGFGGGGGFFNSCSSKIKEDSLNFGVPKNSAGYQEAKTGNGYVSITAFALQLENFFYEGQLSIPKGLYCEYVTIKLKTTNIGRLNYKGTYYVSACGLSGYLFNTIQSSDTCGYRSYTTSSMGMYLCDEIPKLKNDRRIEVKAQINNDINNNLDDTINWMEVSGIFEANGTEQYLLIGSFNDSTDTHYKNSYGYKEPWLNKLGIGNSYFVDDVSLIPQNTTHYYDSMLCSNATLLLGAVAQADSFEWHDGNKTDKLRNFTTPGLVWVKSWLYGGTVYMWDSINIIAQNIQNGLPKDTFMCHEQAQLLLKSTNTNPTATYLWNNGSTHKSLLVNNVNWVNGKTQVWLTTTANYCTQTDTVTITQKPAIPIPITDTTTCFEDVPQILLDAGANYSSYLWQPTGETSKTVYSRQAQIYKLTVTDSFNCTASKSIVVDEQCKAVIYLPNAFTPNGDGKNENFKPILKTKNLLHYQLTIYNSWGMVEYSTTNPSQGWDAQNSSVGVYVVEVNYQYKGFVPTTITGTVTVIR